MRIIHKRVLIDLEITVRKKEPCRKGAHGPGAHIGKIVEMESQEITSRTSPTLRRWPRQAHRSGGHVFEWGAPSGGSGFLCVATEVGL